MTLARWSTPRLTTYAPRSTWPASAWDQLREQLNDAISGGNVTPAADVVVENAVEADAEAAEPSTEA